MLQVFQLLVRPSGSVVAAEMFRLTNTAAVRPYINFNTSARTTSEDPADLRPTSHLFTRKSIVVVVVVVVAIMPVQRLHAFMQSLPAAMVCKVHGYDVQQ